MIKIIGLGPGDPQALTVGTMEELKKNKNIYLRTEIHPTVEFIQNNAIKYKTYDYLYETCSNFDDVYDNIARDLIKKYRDEGSLVYAVPGHPLVAEKSVSNLIQLCKSESIEYKVVPAVSFIDAMMERLEIDPIGGLKLIDAFDISNQILDKRIGTIITQVYNNLIASEVKIKLSEFYDDETEIIYCRAVGIEGHERIQTIKLFELDMQEDIDYLTSIYIPKDNNNKKDIYDLIQIVEVLRGENGCPWDREQTHESIKKAVIEESYEVVDAIENQDYDALVEELGDVLLQVVFHAVLEKEEGFFNFTDIVEGICNKMIYRHPHVFSDSSINNTEEVLIGWEQLKNKEKNYKNIYEELQGVARALPALIRAKKVQQKTEKVECGILDVNTSVENINEQIKVFLEVYKTKDKEKITEKVGELLFNFVSLSRCLGIDSEESLNKATDEFINKFEYINK